MRHGYIAAQSPDDGFSHEHEYGMIHELQSYDMAFRSLSAEIEPSWPLYRVEAERMGGFAYSSSTLFLVIPLCLPGPTMTDGIRNTSQPKLRPRYQDKRFDRIGTKFGVW